MTDSPTPSHGDGPRVFDASSKLVAGIIGVLAVVAGILVGLNNPFLRHVASVEGSRIDMLFNITLGIGVAIFVVVQGFLVYSVIRFGREPGDESDGMTFRDHPKLEFFWTLIPAVIVVFIGLISFQVLEDIERPGPNDLVVEVTAMQYAWEFYYPEADVTTTEMHIPQDRQVHLKLRSKDVIHSFWVPDFRVKKDVMPDRVTETFITGTEPGTFPIVCTELCGAGHALMRAQVVVESDGDFRTWLASQKQASSAQAAGTPDSLQAGRKAFTVAGCNACHTLTDAKATGQMGPNLDGIGSRAAGTVAGQSAEEYLHLSIDKPNDHIAEGFSANIMPQDYDLRLSEQDIMAIVTYLLEQK